MNRIRRPRLCPQQLSPGVVGESDANEHQAVLVKEAIVGLAVKPHGIYIDATFGRGGHSREILKLLAATGKLIVIDKDSVAIAAAKTISDPRLIVKQGSFTKLQQWCDELNIVGNVAGILLDLGVSSPQLDVAARGFSFLHDGPLDMRMDLTAPLTVAEWLHYAKEQEIARVLKEYGEERFARRIAKAIVQARVIAPIVTTGQLAEIVSQANPRWEKTKHPATRSFQALRIFINNELVELRQVLQQALGVLAVGGRLAVISFHSLEDRIVKEFMRKNIHCDLPSKLPLRHEELPQRIKKIGAAIHATASEINHNIRARSAILRIMEKLQ